MFSKLLMSKGLFEAGCNPQIACIPNKQQCVSSSELCVDVPAAAMAATLSHASSIALSAATRAIADAAAAPLSTRRCARCRWPGLDPRRPARACPRGFFAASSEDSINMLSTFATATAAVLRSFSRNSFGVDHQGKLCSHKHTSFHTFYLGGLSSDADQATTDVASAVRLWGV